MAGETCSPPFRELLAVELRLDPWQWGPGPMRQATRDYRNADVAAADPGSEAVLEVDCLVHEEWVRGASEGVLPPPHVPPLPAEEVHWLLQTSCDCPAPQNWLRVSVLCLRKASELDPHTSGTAKRFLIPQERVYSKTSIHELLTQISQENLLSSWQEVLQSVHTTPSTGHRQPTDSYIREVVYKLYHTEIQTIVPGPISALKRKHSTPQDKSTSAILPLQPGARDRNFSPDATTGGREEDRQTHCNLSPLLAALEGRHAFYLVFPYSRFTLLDVARHSPAMFNDSTSKPLFVLFQLLKVLEHCHGVGVTLGALSLRSIFVDSRLWVTVRIPGDNLRLISSEKREGERGEVSSGQEGEKRGGRGADGGRDVKLGKARERKTSQWMERKIRETMDDSPSASASTVTVSDPEIEAELSESAKDTSSESSPAKQLSVPDHGSPSAPTQAEIPDPPAIPLSEAVKLWQHGTIDNFTYLLLLNKHAGRRLGDANNHPIFPWVCDFTHSTRGFRDLTKSKFRLSKGDDQLNFTYNNARDEMKRGADADSSPTPHHVGDILTDVTYYVYKARQTPREVLCTHVRPRWVPEEYPSSMEKMYTWTPDECIPEFFTDPLLFRSIHPDLPDLTLPTWCDSPESFVAAHRQILEGDFVSSQLHHWIDLTFGYKLSGEAAVRAKNVYISLVDKHKNPKNHGIVQLFRVSHPKRAQGSCASVALLEWETYLGQSRVSDGASFPIDRQEIIARFVRGSSTLGRGDGGGGGGRVHVRTLESIVEQQIQGGTRNGWGDGEGEDEADGEADPAEEPSHLDSSFEQIPFPNESFSSNTHPGFPNISYSDSPLDPPLPPPALSTQQGKMPGGGAPAVRFKEGAVLNSAQTHPGGQNRFRVARYFRQRRHTQSDGNGDEYPWQGVEIGLPRETHVLQGLVEQEERAHFVMRCCKDFGDSLGPPWEQTDLEEVASATAPPHLPPLVVLLTRMDSDPLFTPSLEERVMVDVASVTVTAVELCCIRELRVATRVHASLRERVEIIRKTLSSGQLRLPSYLRNLVELVLAPDTRRGAPPSNSHLSLPNLTPSLLLQPFLPVVSFPAYFESLNTFASSLELLSRQAGLNRHQESSLKPLASPIKPSPAGDFDPGIVSNIMESVSENLNSLVASTAHGEGFVLLLLHLYPLFQYPQTSFEMVQTHLDTVGRHMSHAQMYRLFASVLVHFFDTPLQPHQQAHLLSRSTADFLIRRFSLYTFLSKFLEFFLEAVLEPDRLSTRGGAAASTQKSVFRLKESESILGLQTQVSEVLPQSPLYDEQKRQSHVSDFTFSVDLSEAGGGAGYQSEGETSSGGDSEGELHPEASLLAGSGVVLGSVGPNMYDIREEEDEEGDNKGERIEGPRERGEGSLRMMLLPQLSFGGQDAHDGTEQRRPQRNSKTTREVSTGDADADREQESSQSTGRIPKSSSTSLLTASLESPVATSGNTSTLTGGELPTLEDSIPTLSTDSLSDPLTSRSAAAVTPGGVMTKSAGGRDGTEFQVGLERGGEGEERLKGGFGEGEGEREGTVPREAEDEEESSEKKTSELRNDPETTAINQRIAEVAGDTLCWLMRRLGPLLATCHIVSPLLNGIHRCFTGIVGRPPRHGPVLGCLAYMAELYGERVLVRLYLPRVEGWVLSATNRMSVKAEANLAASLALVRLITRQISDLKLEEVTSSLCEAFFIPLIQLLSSQTVFPSGSKARATVCHSLVLLLLHTGRRLGRERSLRLLLETLRLFFTCFDGVYGAGASEDLRTSAGSRGRSESAATSMTSSHGGLSTQTSAPHSVAELSGAAAGATGERGRAVTDFAESARLPDSRKTNFVTAKKKTVSLEEQDPPGGPRDGKGFARPKPSTQDMALEQLQETFTPAMAHATYIPFCKLLGQISVNMELRNTELIEHMAYSYDDRAWEENRPLPSVFLPSGDDRSSSDSGSEDSLTDDTTRTGEEDLVRDVTVKLGPVLAMQQKRGLGGDAVSFGRPSWFIDLQQEVGTGDIGGGSSLGPGDGSGVERGNESLVATTGVSSGGGGNGGVSVSGVGEGVTRSVGVSGGGEEGGGRGWMEGVRGSAMATASGILGLIQNRPTQEMSHGRGTKASDLTRHSINFDMKFQSVLASQQQQQQLSSQNSIDGGVEEADSHLTGQWSDLWESRLHQSPHHLENYTHFMGKKLQIYTGHKGAVRSLAVSDSEHFFLSASKDRTVKLWLLRNQGGGSAQISAHLTYSQHQKPVSQVELVPTTGDILSCDGTVHLWDPEFGHTIHQYSSPRGREFIAMTTLLPPQQVAIVATNDPALGFIDFRTHTIQHTWKIHPSFGNLVKCLSCGDNWVAVGSTGGTVSTLDLRMGALLHQWRPSEFNLVPTTTWNENLFQLLSTRHGNLVTSVGAGTMHLWRPSTGKLLSHIRGQLSTTPCLDYMGQQLISASSNGQVVVHNSFERTKDPSSTLFWVTKVRSRELKGGVVSMATLQEKRLLLLGSENGQVVLMS